jgi:glycosyltransferase involved in cell wall biosynthesis
LALVVHLIDFHHRNRWVEKQLDYFQSAGIELGLISISERGKIHEHLESQGLKKIDNFRPRFFGFLKVCFTLKKWDSRDELVIYAHGHIPSIFASLFRTFIGVKFVICHHQPSPKLFTNLRKRIFFKATLHSMLANFYYKRATSIQVLSLEIENALLSLGLDSEKLVRVPLGLEFENFYNFNSQRRDIPAFGEIVLVSVSRLAWEKRIDLGLRTVANLIKEGLPIKYLVTGAGPELNSLKSLVLELEVSDHVDFLGYQDDVNGILNKADVFFHLSLTEAYGQAIMEARLTDLPIFTSACGVALDMEKSVDPSVKIFRSDSSLQIAGELREFVLNLQSLPNRKGVYAGREFYKTHDYRLVMLEIVRLFICYFESSNKKN